MITTSNFPAVDTVHLDAVLSSALALSWDDLMPEGPPSGLIHIEYHVESLGSVEFVKVWASTNRGHWDLVCEDWMRSGASNQSGLKFANGYKSDRLRGMLESIMQHQEAEFI